MIAMLRTLRRAVPPLLAIFAVCAFARIDDSTTAEPPAEIRLGKAPVPAPRPDIATVHGIERFLAARQSASLDRARMAAARRWLGASVKADDVTLAGPAEERLVAFDFRDGAVERLEGGRVRVTVYLLFADREGRVAESRDEVLIFSGPASSMTCVGLRSTGTMKWGSDEVVKTASRLHAGQALDDATAFLRGWATRQTRLAAWSIEDVYPVTVGRIMLPCLKFTAESGKRGYDVVDAPIMMRRGPKGYQLELPAN
jgi:hypothetical protein